MKQHLVKQYMLALLLGMAFVLLALPSMAFASGYDTDTYDTLEEAVAEAVIEANETGGEITITLLKDVTTDDTLKINNEKGSITLDLDGYSITYMGGSNASVISVGSGATFTLVDKVGTGTITGSNTISGGGVYVLGGGTFIMTGGTITGNNAINGGGVYIKGGSSFTMTGGAITGNNAISGGGVYLAGSSSSVSITGGTISGNTASSNGGGVYANNGAFSVSSGTITGNSASSGGGVYVNKASCNITGGSISGNSVSSGGVDVYASNNMLAFTLGGSPTIGTGSGGVYLASNAIITLSATTPLASGASIVVDTATQPTSADDLVTVAYSDATLTATDFAAFTTTSTTAGLGLAEHSIYLTLAPTLTVARASSTSSTAVVYTLTPVVSDNTNYTYTVTDASGKAAGSVTGDTLTLTTAGVYSITVTDNATGVSSAATTVSVYSATFDYATNMLVGTDQVGGISSAALTLPSATSRSGYTFMGWLSDGVTYAAGQTIATNADTDYIAVWKATVTATATTYYVVGLGTNGYGSITPMVDGYDYVLVAQGGTVVFAFNPADGYEVSAAYVDGVSIGAASGYTVSSISANTSIYVVFTPVVTDAAEAAVSTATAAPTGVATTTNTNTSTSTKTSTSTSTAADTAPTEDATIAEDATLEDAALEDATIEDTAEPEAATQDTQAADTAAADTTTTATTSTTQADDDDCASLPYIIGGAVLGLAVLSGCIWWFLNRTYL